MRTSLSLRRVLVLLAVLAVLPSVAIVTLGSLAEQREQIAGARAELTATARLVASNQAQLIEGVRYALTALASSPAVRRPDLLALCTDYMATLQGKFNTFANFGLFDMTGHLICQFDRLAPKIYAGDRAYYTRALQTGDFAVGDYIVGRVTGKASLPFGMPVFGTDMRPRGVVFAALDLALANAQFKALGIPRGSRVFVTDANGVLLLSSLDNAALIGKVVTDTGVLAAVQARRSQSFDATDAQGTAWLHEVRPIGSIGSNGLFVAVSTRRTDALAPPLQRLRLQIAALGIAAALGMLLAWGYGNQAVALPAQRLLQRMQRVARGEAADLPSPEARSREFIALDEALSSMAGQLQQRERERVELVQQLVERAQQLTIAQRVSRTTHWVMELPSRHVTWSGFAREVLGFEPDAGPGAMAAYLARVHPADRQQVQQAQAGILAGVAPDLEHRVVREDGSTGWVHALGEIESGPDGEPLRFIGSLQDITERKRTDEAMTLLQTAVSRLNDIVLITEAEPFGEPGPRIVFVNDAFERRTGYRRDEVIGKTPRILQGPRTSRAALDRIGAAMKLRQPVREELVNYTRDGTPFWLELDIVPIADASGWFTHWVAVERDITERKESEARFREQEARLTAAMDAARLGVFEVDLATDHIVWGGHHEALWGYAPGEFDGSRAMFEQRIDPGYLPTLRAGLDLSRKRGTPFSREYRVMWPDGSVHWVADGGRYTLDADGVATHLAGVVMDITERKQGEERIEQMNQRIGTLLESMTSGFLALDRELRLTYVNQQAARLLGHDAGELLGQIFTQVFPQVKDGPFYEPVRRALEAGEAQHTEAYAPLFHRWFECHAYPAADGVSVFFQDITPRKQAEHALTALVQRLQALSDMDGALLEAHDAGEIAAIGLRHLQSIRPAWQSAVTVFDTETAIATLLCVEGASGSTFRAGQSRPMAALGEDVLRPLARGDIHQEPDLSMLAHRSPLSEALFAAGVRAHLRVPITAEGALIGMLSIGSNEASPFSGEHIDVAREIADRIGISLRQAALRERIDLHAQQLEQRVAERTQEVEAANKELEAFSYSVSHDLRAPLQAIDGFSRVLQQHHAGRIDARGQHYLARIRAGTAQMAQLIDDLLLLARVSRSEAHLERVDLAGIAHAVIERLRSRDAARRVQVDIAPHLMTKGDSRLLTVALENLLDNAWKFSSKTTDAHIEFGQALGADGQAAYFVADNGAGFDMAYAGKLFGPFQRLHSTAEFPGTGIGLATVHRIVTRHGGRVWAESLPGVRTVVHFTLGGTVSA